MTDIGTGSYTIIAQTAAEMMGVPLEQGRRAARRFQLSGVGRLRRPVGRQQLDRRRLCRLREAARAGRAAGSASTRPTPIFADGEVRSGDRARAAGQAAREGELVAEDCIEFGDLAKKYQQSTFGAHFVEVGVDAATGEIRVRRMLAVCAAGRILNPKTARSQVIGAMTMGVGAALMEELVGRQARAASSSTTTSPATRCRCTPTSRTRR